MPKTVTFPSMDEHNDLLSRLEVLETAEQQREERHERKLEPEEMIEMADNFRVGPWYRYVERKFLQFEHDGYYNADDEETHIFDDLCESFDKATAFAFRNAYAPIKAVITRYLMRDHPWARPPVSKKDRCVTKIRGCKVDPYLWKRDPLGYAWLREWHERLAKARAKRQKAKADDTD